jgi:phosphate transport system ATP-binding protein
MVLPYIYDIAGRVKSNGNKSSTDLMEKANEPKTDQKSPVKEARISFDYTDRAKKVKLESKNANVFYGDNHVIKNVSLQIREKTVTAFIGPSGCGKSTFLRLFNRMNDYIESFHKDGGILIDGKDIYDEDLHVEDLRKNVGMVFQKPNPFPKSIYENVVYGLKIQGIKDKKILEQAVEESLISAALWDEVKDQLNKSALALSGGQQQRLCIARALAVKPTVLLMDEPASALDPIATAKIEELIHVLKNDYTIVIVTHNMQQAGRVSDKTAFFYLGELIEFENTKDIFINPRNELTERYITGRFG